MRLQSDARPRHCWHASRGPDRKLPGTRRRLEADSLVSEIPRGAADGGSSVKSGVCQTGRAAEAPPRQAEVTWATPRRRQPANRRQQQSAARRRPSPASSPAAGRPTAASSSPTSNNTNTPGAPLTNLGHPRSAVTQPIRPPKGRRGLRRHVPGRLTQSRSPTARALDYESDVGDAGELSGLVPNFRRADA